MPSSVDFWGITKWASASATFIDSANSSLSVISAILFSWIFSAIDILESVATIAKFFGTQFHPEKSDKIGLKIISNFLKL